MSCEQALGIEIPDRAKAIRMVILELVRIHHHILCLEKVFSFHHFCDDLEILACAKRVEALFFRFTSSKDNRINKPISIIGGLTSELPADWSVECMSCLEVLDGVFSSLRDRLVRSSFFMNEVKVCPFTAMEALSWGLSGPGLRACGVNYDLRKSNPFYFYKDVDFEVPLGINGDCYDRFLVLLSEIVQSTRVISQVIDHLPGGSILAYEAKEFDFKNVTLPVGDYYYSIESPKGEFGFYQVSSGEDKPYRVKLRTPSFCDAQSIEAAIEGNRFDEALTYINSLCLSPLEVDK
jgi:NADH:ubiquinone oxidoreductase subunit D